MFETDYSFAARVRSVLTELIPGGRCTADDAAEKLGTSKRSLQRRLKEESTNFQQQLNHTRELLAKYYIAHTKMNTEDIAFLLGYQDINSFLRAVTLWTGQNLTEYKNNLYYHQNKHTAFNCSMLVCIYHIFTFLFVCNTFYRIPCCTYNFLIYSSETLFFKRIKAVLFFRLTSAQKPSSELSIFSTRSRQ